MRKSGFEELLQGLLANAVVLDPRIARPSLGGLVQLELPRRTQPPRPEAEEIIEALHKLSRVLLEREDGEGENFERTGAILAELVEGLQDCCVKHILGSPEFPELEGLLSKLEEELKGKTQSWWSDVHTALQAAKTLIQEAKDFDPELEPEELTLQISVRGMREDAVEVFRRLTEALAAVELPSVEELGRKYGYELREISGKKVLVSSDGRHQMFLSPGSFGDTIRESFTALTGGGDDEPEDLPDGTVDA